MKRGPEDREERIASRREQALELIALGEREGGQAPRRIQGLELAAQVAQPRARSGGLPSGAHDIPEQHDRFALRIHARRLLRAEVAVNV